VGLDSRGRFLDQLRQLRVDAGSPKQAELVRRMPAVLTSTSVSELLKGKGPVLPPWERIEAFVIACVRAGVAHGRTMPAEEMLVDQWRKRYDALAVAVDLTAPGGPVTRATGGKGTATGPKPDQDSQRRRFGTVPPRAGAFQRRAVGQVLLEDAGSGGTPVLTGARGKAASVLVGLGGVGKTQLAADHAHTQWEQERVGLLMWVTARTRDSVVSAYTEVARALLGQDSRFPDRAVRRLVNWLAETDTPWLVVLDDLQDPADLSGLWPPQAPGGQVVVTTRRRDAALHGHQRRVVDIDLFSPIEALAYLIEKVPARARTPAALAELEALAAELGYLPLALAQAAAHLINKPLLATADYRAKLADRRTTLNRVLPRERELPDEHERTVALTWSLSVEAADALEPAGLARPVLELASLLDPAGIPAPFFTTTALTNHLTTRLRREVTGEDVSDGLACLHRFSLIAFNERSAAGHLGFEAPPPVVVDVQRPDFVNAELSEIRVHSLVQRATREDLSDYRTTCAAKAAADALLEIWPDFDVASDLGHVLRANTTTLAACAASQLWKSGGYPVLFRSGRSIGEHGEEDLAIEYFRDLRQAAAEHLGADHPHTLIANRYLTHWQATLDSKWTIEEWGNLSAYRMLLWQSQNKFPW
jgi:hypothetical protein